MGTVSGHQLSTFSSPVNGTSPIDANTVRGNDNTIKTSYNAHDADTTIHLQNGLVATRPSASTAGQTWLATDTGAVYLWLDTGSAWVEANYLRNTGGTVSGQVVVVSTTGPQLTVEYDGTHTYTVSVDASGNATLNATGTLTITPALTLSSLAVSGTSKFGTVSGTTGSSSGDAIFGGAIRGVVSGTTYKVADMTSAGRVRLGGGYSGESIVQILGSTAPGLPAGGSTENGNIVIDTTNGRLVWYDNGVRRYVAGTTF